MNEALRSWAGAWVSQQQALLKALHPMASASADNGEATNPMQAQFTELRETWRSSLEKWIQFAQEGVNLATTDRETLSELFSPLLWGGLSPGSLDAGLRQLLDGPKYATLYDLDRQMAELQMLALQRDRHLATYQAIVQKGWNTAFERFCAGLSPSGADTDTPTWRATADRWLSVANDTLIELHRSSDFLQAQRNLLRSASDYRLQQRKIGEAWCEASQIPTRTEVDTLQRTVAELRRQLRALQRATGASQVEGADRKAPVRIARSRNAKPSARSSS